jgi:hypothetical protein
MIDSSAVNFRDHGGRYRFEIHFIRESHLVTFVILKSVQQYLASWFMYAAGLMTPAQPCNMVSPGF